MVSTAKGRKCKSLSLCHAKCDISSNGGYASCTCLCPWSAASRVISGRARSCGMSVKHLRDVGCLSLAFFDGVCCKGTVLSRQCLLVWMENRTPFGHSSFLAICCSWGTRGSQISNAHTQRFCGLSLRPLFGKMSCSAEALSMLAFRGVGYTQLREDHRRISHADACWIKALSARFTSMLVYLANDVRIMAVGRDSKEV